MYLINAADQGWCPQCLVGKAREGCPVEEGSVAWALFPWLKQPQLSWHSHSPELAGHCREQPDVIAEGSSNNMYNQNHYTQKWLKSSLRGCCHSTWEYSKCVPNAVFLCIIIILEFKYNLGSEIK